MTVSRLTTAVLLAGIAVFAGLYLVSIGPYWNISPDSASYVQWGQSLAAGAGWGSPPITPPLTPFVFAAVLWFFPTGYTALNALTPLLIFCSLGFTYVMLERRAGRNPALLAVLLSLAATPLHYASTQLLTEPVYMICSLGALLLLDGYPNREEGTEPGAAAPTPRLRTWLGGILVVATALTRTIGVTLALAVLLAEGVAWLRRRRKPNRVLAVFALISLASVPLWQAYSEGSYASILFRTFVKSDPWAPGSAALSSTDLLERIRDNLRLVPRAGGMLLNGMAIEHHTLNVLLQVAGTLAIAWGLWLAVRRRAGVTELYLVLYAMAVAAYMLSTGDGGYRFLVPVAPLLFFYALEAARHLGRSLTRAFPFRGMALLLGGLGAFYLFGYFRIGWDRAILGVANAHSSPFGDHPIKRAENFDAQRLAHWLRDNSRPEDRYAAGQRDMFNVLSGRRGDDILLSYTYPSEALVARLERGGVRYVLVDRINRPLGDSLLAAIRANPDRFLLISDLPKASLYEFKPKRQE